MSSDPNPSEWTEASRLASSRRDAYRVLASLFLQPPPTDAQGISRLAACIVGCCGAVNREVVEEIEAALTQGGAAGDLAADFQALLAVQTERNLVPIESVYADATFDGTTWNLGCLRSDRWAAVTRSYAEAGFEVDATAAVEADHISCELEFLARLCEAEAAAWAARDLDTAMARRGESMAFLAEHPASWLLRLRQRADDLARTTYYRRLPLLVERFVCLELEQLQEAS